MPETPPTIPQIVRALTTINDRHVDALREQSSRHEEEMRLLKARVKMADEAVLGRNCLVDELKTVIATLCSRIERTQNQLKRDNQNAVYSEPLELMNLLGRTADPEKLISRALEKAREAKRAELERQKTANSVADQTPCRICMHTEDRHMELLPEEGGRNYCSECLRVKNFPAGDHAFEGAVSADWDRCLCGHTRGEHADGVCNVCQPDYGKSHDFALKR